MNTLKRFGNALSTTKLYTFPANAQVMYQDNFAQLVTKTVRLAGVNGGYSNLGGGRGLSPIGTVRADLRLTFNSIIEATDKVNSLRQMADWGLQPLYRQQLYGAEQFCWARVTDIQTPMNVGDVPHLRMKVTVIFEVPDPFWYRTVSGFGFLWDDGIAKWDDSVSIWDANSGFAVGASTTLTFTNSGNYFTLPRFQLYNAAVASLYDIRVQRLVDGYAEDEFYYDGLIATNTYLDVDPVRQRVSIGPTGVNALDKFRAKSPDWLRLVPGSNSIKIMTSGGVSTTLYMQYMERFV